MSWMSLVNEQKHARHQHFCAVRNVPQGWMLSTRQEFLFHMLHDNGCVGESVLWKKETTRLQQWHLRQGDRFEVEFFSFVLGDGRGWSPFLHHPYCNQWLSFDTNSFKDNPKERERERASTHHGIDQWKFSGRRHSIGSSSIRFAFPTNRPQFVKNHKFFKNQNIQFSSHRGKKKKIHAGMRRMERN